LFCFCIKSLTTLDLAHNRIGPEGTRDLAIVLQKQTVRQFFFSFLLYLIYSSIQTLTTLNLYNNYIGFEGRQYLVDMLRINKVKLIIKLPIILGYLSYIHFYSKDTQHIEPWIEQNWL